MVNVTVVVFLIVICVVPVIEMAFILLKQGNYGEKGSNQLQVNEIQRRRRDDDHFHGGSTGGGAACDTYCKALCSKAKEFVCNFSKASCRCWCFFECT